MRILKALLINAEELPMPCAAAMEEPDYLSLGLADAAQIALCAGDIVLLTDDAPLHRTAVRRGIGALNCTDEKFRRRRFLV